MSNYKVNRTFRKHLQNPIKLPNFLLLCCRSFFPDCYIQLKRAPFCASFATFVVAGGGLGEYPVAFNVSVSLVPLFLRLMAFHILVELQAFNSYTDCSYYGLIVPLLRKIELLEKLFFLKKQIAKNEVNMN